MNFTKEQKITIAIIAIGSALLVYSFTGKIKAIITPESKIPSREDEPNFHFNGGSEVRESELNFNAHGTTIPHGQKVEKKKPSKTKLKINDI